MGCDACEAAKGDPLGLYFCAKHRVNHPGYLEDRYRDARRHAKAWKALAKQYREAVLRADEDARDGTDVHERVLDRMTALTAERDEARAEVERLREEMNAMIEDAYNRAVERDLGS